MCDCHVTELFILDKIKTCMCHKYVNTTRMSKTAVIIIPVVLCKDACVGRLYQAVFKVSKVLTKDPMRTNNNTRRLQ